MGSDESITFDDLELVQCFLPTGMVLDVSVHPDDELFQIKHFVLGVATADGKFDSFLSMKKGFFLPLYHAWHFFIAFSLWH